MAMNGKDKLMNAPENLTDPREYKPKSVSPKAGSGTEGKNQLLKLTDKQCRPAGAEDDGDNKPMPADRSRVVSAGFKTEVSKTESGSVLNVALDVDMKTGKHTSPDQKM